MVGDTDWEPPSLVVCAAADVNDDEGGEATGFKVVVATDLVVIIGIDVDDGFFKVTADELGFTEEDVLEEEDSETVPKVDATVVEVVSTVVEVVATVVEVVATVVELVTTVVKVVDERTTVRVTVLKMTIDPRSRKSICSKMISKWIVSKPESEFLRESILYISQRPFSVILISVCNL